jgi:anti-sigma B factor antagonist
VACPKNRSPFRVTVLYKPRRDGVEATIVLEGELDMSGTTLFWACANEALGCRSRSIIVDAADLTFIDSAGVMALWCAREAADAAGVPLVVTKATRPVRPVVELRGLNDLLRDG